MSAVATTTAGELPAGRLGRALVRPGAGSLVAFAAAAVGAGLGRAMTTTYLPVLLNEVREAPGLIGTVMLVNAAAGFAVPLAVGAWSDRAGRRLPFVLGGSLVAGGGSMAVALGSGSSYLVLTLAGTAVYIGLNSITTAHRALVAESFALSGRARATSAQELALLVGGLAGLAAGGLFVEVAAWAPFALASVLIPLLALPTLARVRERPGGARHEQRSRPAGSYARAVTRPGVPAFLLAQVLWVLGYAGLPVFFVLYADRVLGLSAGPASLALAGFGLATGATLLGAGRVRDPARHKPLLVLGVALMGAGLLAVAATTSLPAVAPALLATAIGFGLISALGFPLFSQLIPEGEAGTYTALYFSVRAVSSAVALPAVGWAIAATGSYRTMFLLGGAVALAALAPLALVPGEGVQRRPRRWPSANRWLVGWVERLAVLYAVILAAGLLSASTGVHRLDEHLFRTVNQFGPGPRPLFDLLEEPARNYLLLGSIAVLATLVTRRRPLAGTLALPALSAALSWGLLEAIYALYDRPRPSEVFDPSTIVLGFGRNWARVESFPSGHMAVVTALAAATWMVFPRLRVPLGGFVALHAVTRVLFGAHFPLDVLAGTALGYVCARLVLALLLEAGALERTPAPVRTLGDLPRRTECPESA